MGRVLWWCVSVVCASCFCLFGRCILVVPVPTIVCCVLWLCDIGCRLATPMCVLQINVFLVYFLASILGVFRVGFCSRMFRFLVLWVVSDVGYRPAACGARPPRSLATALHRSARFLYVWPCGSLMRVFSL